MTEIDEKIKALWNSGMSDRQIAAELEVSQSLVCRHRMKFSKHDPTFRETKQGNRTSHSKRPNTQPEQERGCFGGGYKEYKMSPEELERYLDKEGIPGICAEKSPCKYVEVPPDEFGRQAAERARIRAEKRGMG